MPRDSIKSTNYPALIVLSCTGAIAKDLDSIIIIADSLHWILATCYRSKNRRDTRLNDSDIMNTYEKLIKNYSVDTSQIFIYGFSGQGVQALITLFLHPDNFRGVIAVCAHKAAMPLAKWYELDDKLIYLISRKEDWNLNSNLEMDNQFRMNSIHDSLVITSGKHTPTSYNELFEACLWLDNKGRGTK